MKSEYSKVNFPELRIHKKEFKQNATNWIINMEQAKYRLRSKSNPDSAYYDENSVLDIYMFQLIQMFVLEDNKNYYISSKELTKMLEETDIKISEPDIKVMFDPKFSILTDEAWSKIFVIHAKGMDNSTFVHLFYDTENDYIGITVASGKEEGMFRVCPEQLKMINSGDIEGGSADKTGKIFRLVLNLLFYEKAFPEYILNKPPDEECDIKNKNNSKTIGMSKQIEDYLKENRDVAPHLRRGHFRFLGSEHFTKKRGQFVFVKSSFVKGNAVTVVEGGQL